MNPIMLIMVCNDTLYGDQCFDREDEGVRLEIHVLDIQTPSQVLYYCLYIFRFL